MGEEVLVESQISDSISLIKALEGVKNFPFDMHDYDMDHYKNVVRKFVEALREEKDSHSQLPSDPAIRACDGVEPYLLFQIVQITWTSVKILYRS